MKKIIKTFYLSVILVLIVMAVIFLNINFKNNNLTVERFNHRATLLNDGRVLITGGSMIVGKYNKEVMLNTAEIYDPKTNKFINIGNMNIKRSLHSATLLKDGRVLIIGGNKESNNTEIFDPNTNTFHTSASTKFSHYGQAAILLKNGKVLIAGGSVNKALSYFRAAEVYDPKSNSFTYIGNVKQPSSLCGIATLLKNSDVLLSSGRLDFTSLQTIGDDYNLFTFYNFSQNQFKTIKQKKVNYFQRCLYSNAIYLNDKVYNFCTLIGSHNTDVEILDPKKFEIVTQSINMIKGIENYILLPIDDENIILIGGHYGGMENEPADIMYIYNLKMNKFISSNKKITPRYYHTATLLQNGKILVTGGLNKDIMGRIKMVKKVDILD